MDKTELLHKTIFLTYPKRLVEDFRRRARRTKNEILAYMMGEACWKKGFHHVVVEDFYYPKLRISNETEVTPAEGLPRGCVGTIHSHPNVETIHVTQDDIHSAIIGNEKVWGVYSYTLPTEEHRRLSAIQWFAPGKIVAVCKEGRKK